MSAYEDLCNLGHELRMLEDTSALLSWDQEVLLPVKGLSWRAEQMAWLSGELHKRFTSSHVGDWIEQCEETVSGQEEKANLREWKWAYKRATVLPVELVKEFSRAQAHAKSAWAEARKKSCFEDFAPHLQKLIELNRRKAEHWGYEECQYDALLETYEKGATVRILDRTLGDLQKELVPLVEEATSQPRFDEERIKGEFPIEKQSAFNREVAESIGFDFEAGRIDTAVHPFCSGMGIGNVRMTTRYDESDFRSSLYGVLHEAGHGLYEQGLPTERHSEPVGKAVSLGVHESQSRLWENHVGRSGAFWEKWLGRATDYFPHLKGISAEEMTIAVNQARRSFIRVEADEVTYDLHIVLRYEMEKAIIGGDLKVEEIPAAWNQRYEELFGVLVDRDSNGCLQDIHWSMGMFGYFPTYSLGNLNASHLRAAACAQDEGVARSFEDGDFQPLLSWMREKIHAEGSLYSPNELVERASGSPVTASAHLDHLRERYLR